MNLRIVKESVEFLALLAILLGLYLVYVEIRQNGVIARAEINSITLQSQIDLRRWKSDPEFSEIYLNGLHAPGELTEAERFRLNEFYENVLIGYSFEYYNYNLGIFAEYTGVPRATSPAIFGAGYGRIWWNVRRKTFNPNIAEVIDNAISELDGANVVLDFDSQIRQQMEDN
jgi:hypothetical protein